MEEKDFIADLLKETESQFYEAAREMQFENYKKEYEKRRGKLLTTEQTKQFRDVFEKVVGSPIKKKE